MAPEGHLKATRVSRICRSHGGLRPTPCPAKPAGAKPQLEGVGRNSRPRLRGLREGRQPEPVPYGTPFSAILSRFTQAPRKSWPTGRRPAAAFVRHPAPAKPAGAKPQLEGVGRNSRPRLRSPREGRQPEPVPYGTPFSAILSRFTQAPRKSWPTGYRSAAAFVGTRRAQLHEGHFHSPLTQSPPEDPVGCLMPYMGCIQTSSSSVSPAHRPCPMLADCRVGARLAALSAESALRMVFFDLWGNR